MKDLLAIIGIGLLIIVLIMVIIGFINLSRAILGVVLEVIGSVESEITSEMMQQEIIRQMQEKGAL